MTTTTRFRAADPGPCVVATLTTEECWRLLERKAFGRLAIAEGRQAGILPLTFDAVEETIVVRSTLGTKLALLAGGADVAFEVDGGDDDGVMRWSVVVSGWAAPTDADDDACLTRSVLRVTPVSITGRAFRAVRADAGEDRRTASRVRRSLRRTRELDATGVRVVAEAGFVTLSGDVASAAERLSAQRAAWELPEVLGVDDLLTLRAPRSEWEFSELVDSAPVPV